MVRARQRSEVVRVQVRSIWMPAYAVTRCGGACSQLENCRELWQKVQFTPSASDCEIISAYAHYACFTLDRFALLGATVCETTRAPYPSRWCRWI